MADKEVTLYELPNYGGTEQTVKEDQPDLSEILPSGASSMKIGAHAKEWRVFTEISYQGKNNTLNAGRGYENLAAMGLDSPVKSMRKAV